MDIVPYSAEDAVRLGQLLARLQVPSIGPGAAAQLLQAANKIKALISDKQLNLSAEEKSVLEGVRFRFLDIAVISAGQQKEILDTLARLCGKAEAGT